MNKHPKKSSSKSGKRPSSVVLILAWFASLISIGLLVAVSIRPAAWRMTRKASS